MKIISIILLILLSSAYVSFSQDWKTYYNTDSGIIINKVAYSIVYDNFDVWVCCLNGKLIKTNGKNWKVWDNQNSSIPESSVLSFAKDSTGYLWIGTDQGLVEFNGQSWNRYDHNNSGLLTPFITCIAIDEINNLWLGNFWGGLVKYDGTDWAVYNSSNSELPSDLIEDILIDKNNNLWIATHNGIANFDGDNWKIFNTSNSILRGDLIYSLAIDKNNNIWVGGGGGVYEIQDSILINRSNGIPSNWVYCIAIDSINDKWIGTKDGLIKLVMTNSSATWKFYNTSNSDIPYNHISSISIDSNNNLWIGSDYEDGLVCFNENEIILSSDIQSLNNTSFNFTLSQNYPNPFNPITYISYSIPKPSYVTIKIYDILGNEITTLVDDYKTVGNYNVEFNGHSLTSGIYFYIMLANNFSEAKKIVLLK